MGNRPVDNPRSLGSLMEPMPVTYPRVLVIGLDGATFDIIQPLIARGRLPNLARLVEEGAWGTLRSTDPPISPTAWNTFATGKNPGKHGIFDFRNLTADYERIARPAQQSGHKSIWRLLSDAGRRVIAIDVPFTFPPEEVNGVMISGYPTPRANGAIYTHPRDLSDRLLGTSNEFRMELGWPEARIDLHPEFFAAWEAVMENREKMLDHFSKNERWDLFMVVFGITDTLAHTLWHFLDPSHPAFRSKNAEVFRERFFRGYELADRALGRLWALAGEETQLIVLSDHGFGTVRPRQWLLQFLVERGWLHFLQPPSGAGLRSRVRSGALKAYTRLGWLRRKMRELRPEAKKRLLGRLKRHALINNFDTIDHQLSAAIPSDMGTHIYLNRQGRFSAGFLDASQAGQLAAEIRRALLDAIDPVDGKPVVKRVVMRDQVYSGEALEAAPDLIVEFANRFTWAESEAPSNPGLEGGHVPEGILLAHGSAFKPGPRDAADIEQLAPTILHLLGEPVPYDMDGPVLEKWFAADWMLQRPITIGEQPASHRDRDAPEFDADQEAAIEEQLRALGYIE